MARRKTEPQAKAPEAVEVVETFPERKPAEAPAPAAKPAESKKPRPAVLGYMREWYGRS